MAPSPPPLLPPLALALAGVALGSFTVLSWPRVAVVTFGGSVTVNCSRSSCPGDNATLTIATSLPATPGPGGLLWQSFRLRNVSRWRPGAVTCSGRCGDTRATASTALIVYQLPRKVALEPVPAVAVGDSANLTCHVLEVAPVANLTVTLRRGTETLRTQSFGDSDGSASVAVSHELIATRGDHGQDVTCHAELSLRPHGPLFARAAAPVRLSVFALPDPPLLLAPSLLEVATSANATCHISGAFPVGDVRVTAALDREPLNVTSVATGDTVTARAELPPLPPGQHELNCTAQVATVAKSATRPLRVYEFPEFALELSPAPAVASREVTVACGVGDTRDVPELQIRDGDGRVLAQGRRARLGLTVVATSGDNGRQFRCRASLEVGDSVVTKEAEARLEVLYPPEFPPSGCPRARSWLRGSRQFLSCLATGNPSPTVLCARHGATVATTEPLVATKSRAGTYECKATNALGTRSRRVTVRVEYEPTLSESGCPERQVWVEGQRWHLECHSDGDPAPRTRCHRRGDNDGDIHGGIQDGGIQDGGIQNGGTRGDTQDGGTHGGTRDGHTQDGGTDGGTRDTQNGGSQDGGTQDGDTQDGGSHGDTQDGGVQDGGTQDGGIQDGGTRYGDTQDGGIQDGGTQDGSTYGDTQDGDTQGDSGHGDTQDGVTRGGGTHDVTRGGPQGPGGRVVTRADGGLYVCRASNRHGVAERRILVTVEYPPSLPERGCPGRRRWLQGAPGELSCRASGNPRPRVTCARIGPERQYRHYRDYRDDDGDYRDDYDDDRDDYRDYRDDDGDYRDDSGSYRDDSGSYRDDTGSYRDDTGSYRDDTGSYRDDTGSYRDDSGRYRDDTGSYRDDTGSYRDDSGRYRDDTGRYRDDTGRYRDDSGSYRDDSGSYRDDTGSYRDDTGSYRDDSGRYRDDNRDYRETENGSHVTANVTRGHAGVYECRASNEHGWASKNVSVAVEFPPRAVSVLVEPSGPVAVGHDTTVHCRALGKPRPRLSWALPPAANVRWARDNRSVAIVGATAANGGRYTCTATNRHGRRAASAELRVSESWLVLLVLLGALGGGSVLASMLAGGFFVRRGACKKGEYNVREAEGCGRPGGVFGIQLTQPGGIN